MREMRISLDAEDFRTLVKGGSVRRDGSGGPVVISLQDIGFEKIRAIVALPIGSLVAREE